MGRAQGQLAAVADDMRRRGPKREWTDERIRDELVRFIGLGRRFPTREDFLAAGRADLLGAVTRHRGASEWAKRMGMPLRGSRDRSEYSEETAVAEAREVIARHGELFGSTKLRQLGYDRLASHMMRVGGGAAGFRARHDL